MAAAGRPTALLLEKAMIDIVDALDVLDSCVADRGADYRSRRRRNWAVPLSERYYHCPAPAESIVSLALIKAGAPQSSVGLLSHKSIADVYATDRARLNLTLGAVVALRAAESMERLGHSWGSCREAALQAASRFVELIPDGFPG
jgi:hypothetical protein